MFSCVNLIVYDKNIVLNIWSPHNKYSQFIQAILQVRHCLYGKINLPCYVTGVSMIFTASIHQHQIIITNFSCCIDVMDDSWIVSSCYHRRVSKVTSSWVVLQQIFFKGLRLRCRGEQTRNWNCQPTVIQWDVFVAHCPIVILISMQEIWWFFKLWIRVMATRSPWKQYAL